MFKLPRGTRCRRWPAPPCSAFCRSAASRARPPWARRPTIPGARSRGRSETRSSAAACFYILCILVQTWGFGTDAAGVKAFATSGAARRPPTATSARGWRTRSTSAPRSAPSPALARRDRGGADPVRAQPRRRSSGCGRTASRDRRAGRRARGGAADRVGAIVVQRIAGDPPSTRSSTRDDRGAGMLVAYIVTNMGAIRYLFIDARRAPLWEIVIPLLGIAFIVYTIYKNRDVHGVPFPYNRFPLVLGVWLVVGLGITLAPGADAPDRGGAGPRCDRVVTNRDFKCVRTHGPGSHRDVGKLELPLQGWERKEVLWHRSFEPGAMARDSRGHPPLARGRPWYTGHCRRPGRRRGLRKRRFVRRLRSLRERQLLAREQFELAGHRLESALDVAVDRHRRRWTRRRRTSRPRASTPDVSAPATPDISAPATPEASAPARPNPAPAPAAPEPRQPPRLRARRTSGTRRRPAEPAAPAEDTRGTRPRPAEPAAPAEAAAPAEPARACGARRYQRQSTAPAKPEASAPRRLQHPRRLRRRQRLQHHAQSADRRGTERGRGAGRSADPRRLQQPPSRAARGTRPESAPQAAQPSPRPAESAPAESAPAAAARSPHRLPAEALQPRPLPPIRGGSGGSGLRADRGGSGHARRSGAA